MNVRKLGWLCLVWVLAGCPSTPAGECGGKACSQSERCDSATLLCVTDAPPTITVVAPTAVVTTATFPVTGKISDDFAVTSAEWKIGSGAWTALVLAADGSFSISVTTPTLDSENVAVSFRARDARTEVTLDAQVPVDRVGPVLRLIRPRADTVLGTATIEVAVDATDGSGSLADLSIDGVASAMPRSGVEAIQIITVPPTQNGEPIAVAVSASDPSGNRTTQNFNVKADRVAPTVRFVAPAANAYITTSSFTAELQVIDPSPIVSAVAQFGPTTLVGTEVSSGRWLFDVLTGIVEADEIISVEVTDAAGNLTTLQTTVRVDRIAPQITVTAPAPASVQGTAFPVAVTTSADTASVTATLEGQQVTLSGGPTAWSGLVPVPQRDYSAATVQFIAVDLAGNSGMTTLNLMVDTVAPSVSFTAPTANQKFNASQLAGNSNVVSTWTVTDGDPQAATATVNGAASTALSTSVPTSANDNPTTYTTTITASDRAGNMGSASVSYSVDRLAPTILAWTPATNTRNVWPAVPEITFSEPVSGPLSTSPALTATGRVPVSDFWYPDHARYYADFLAPGQVIDLALATGLADAYGNPVLPTAARRFHVAPNQSTPVRLATGVSRFASSSDSDGEITVAFLKTNGQLSVLTDVAGTLTINDYNARGTTVTVNSSNVVNATTLRSDPSFGVSVFDAAAAAGAQYTHLKFSGGVIGAFSGAPAGSIVSQGPLNREPATDATGIVFGTSYYRDSYFKALPTPADMVTAQSRDSWAVVSRSGNLVRWSRFRCNRDTRLFPGPDTFTCGGTEYAGSMSPLVPDFVEAVMTRSGNCLVINANAPQGAGTYRGGFIQRLENCDGALAVSPPASCTSNTSIPLYAGFSGQRIATFSGNGEDTVLFAFPANTGNPNEFRMEKMLPGVCAFSTTNTPPFSASNVRDFAPIQVGTRAGFLYVNTSNELWLQTP